MNIYVLAGAVSSSDLQQINNQLKIFSIAQKVSIVLAVIFFLLTALIFWRMRIWELVLQRTGLAKKKSISQLQELNALSGRLTQNSGAQIAAQEFTGQLTGEKKKSGKTGHFGQGKQSASPAPSAPRSQPAQPEVQETSVLSQSAPQYQGTFRVTDRQVVIHTDETIDGR